MREVGNAVEHAVALARGEMIAVEHLPDDLVDQPHPFPHGEHARAVERAHILRTLDACAGNQAEAAKHLGIGRNTLWRKLREYGATS